MVCLRCRCNVQYSSEYISVKIDEIALIELVMACPCACNMDCGDTHMPTGKPSIGPASLVDSASFFPRSNVDGDMVEDQALCFDERCHDDPAYVTKFGTSCADHHGLMSSSENCYDSWIETNGSIKLTGECTANWL